MIRMTLTELEQVHTLALTSDLDYTLKDLGVA